MIRLGSEIAVLVVVVVIADQLPPRGHDVPRLSGRACPHRAGSCGQDVT
jgi:hypothetical protein